MMVIRRRRQTVMVMKVQVRREEDGDGYSDVGDDANGCASRSRGGGVECYCCAWGERRIWADSVRE